MDTETDHDAPVDAPPESVAPIADGSPPPAAEPRSSRLAALLFRFGLLYFLIYTHPFPVHYIPTISSIVSTVGIDAPSVAEMDPVPALIGKYTTFVSNTQHTLVDTVAEHIFGFTEPLERPYGSGDPTYSYVRIVLNVSLALLLTIIWSFFSRPRRHPLLAAWLHLGARYFLAFTMFSYGFAKVFPSQFRWPSLGRLVSDYGDSSPMNVLWTFMGSSAPYTVFAGAGEVLAGVLLCFRKTATLGALVAAGVMANVVALNFFYDVPVKLSSSHLLLFGLVIASVDLRRLMNLFVFNRPAASRDLSMPRFPVGIGHIAKLLIVAPIVVGSVTRVVTSYTAEDDPGPHYGIWDVERFADDSGDVESPWHALLFERSRQGRGGGSLQLADHELRHGLATWSDDQTELTLSGASRWRYEREGDELVMRGEFQRYYRDNPYDRSVASVPRGPQIERRFRLDADAELPEFEPQAEPEPAEDDSEETVAAPPTNPLSEELVGRWVMTSEEIISETATRRREDPARYEALVIAKSGEVFVEFADAASETYAASVDATGILTFAWMSNFAVTKPDADTLGLVGTHRGCPIEVDLTRRDLNSYLLVRRGFHWINEMPLNTF